MNEKIQKLITYETQAIFETVDEQIQGVGVLEKGEYRFVDCSVAKFFAYNELYYATSLTVAKRLAKDVLGTSHAAPYFFMDMVWVPLQIYNRSVIIYIALHHFERICEVTKEGVIIELSYGTRLHLDITKHVFIMRLFVALLLKELIAMKKKTLYERPKLATKRYEIVKEPGSVYYTVKDEDN